MVTIYNTTLSATSQRHFSDGLGGGGVLASGIATLRGVRSNLKEIASGYNSGKTGTEVSFGPTGNGIGIAVRF